MFISVVFTQLLPRTPNHFPLPRHWTRDRDFRPATAPLDPRPRHWTRNRDFGPATREPRLLVKLCCDTPHGRHSRRSACLGLHVLRAYCKFESKQANSITLSLGDAKITRNTYLAVTLAKLGFLVTLKINYSIIISNKKKINIQDILDTINI